MKLQITWPIITLLSVIIDCENIHLATLTVTHDGKNACEVKCGISLKIDFDLMKEDKLILPYPKTECPRLQNTRRTYDGNNLDIRADMIDIKKIKLEKHLTVIDVNNSFSFLPFVLILSFGKAEITKLFQTKLEAMLKWEAPNPNEDIKGRHRSGAISFGSEEKLSIKDEAGKLFDHVGHVAEDTSHTFAQTLGKTGEAVLHAAENVSGVVVHAAENLGDAVAHSLGGVYHKVKHSENRRSANGDDRHTSHDDDESRKRDCKTKSLRKSYHATGNGKLGFKR
jgi:hypothetical protein